MAGNWVKLTGETQYNGTTVYGVNMDTVTYVALGESRDGIEASLSIDGGNSLLLSAEDAEVVRRWLDANSYTYSRHAEEELEHQKLERERRLTDARKRRQERDARE